MKMSRRQDELAVVIQDNPRDRGPGAHQRLPESRSAIVIAVGGYGYF